MRLGNGRLRLLAALACATAVFTARVDASTITILNNDGVGEGFNDPTPVAPVGGNAGVTLGQQRLNVFQHAANIWGALLPSTQVIIVRAQFNPQTCTATSAVLGSAGAVTIHRDFPSAPFAGTWYNAALGNKLSSSDLSPLNPDINATFNSNLGLAGCGFSWYYGLDGNEGTATELLPVVL
ncbi:MAG: peptidase, partial [Candidatus Eisenbacteria bacterium]